MVSTKTVRLVVSIGNPDPKYANTYHNTGHRFADYLAARPEAEKVKVVKSDSYMNASGAFVKKLLLSEKIKPESLLITHDDSDLLVGEYKISYNRGSGGHKGVENIITALKTKEFWRLRIGIRPAVATGEPRLKAEEFVLKPVSQKDEKLIEETFARATKALNEIFTR